MLRKFLNIPSKAQKIVLEQDEALIIERCNSIAQEEYSDLLESQKIYDGVCPCCKSKGKMIVDKITDVQSDFETKLMFGCGKIKIYIDTIPINHCNECGHEWKKFKAKHISGLHIQRVSFLYLNDLIIEKKIQHKWKIDVIQVFDGCTAEALYKLNIWKATNISLSMLRHYYKSVYSKKEQNLEKL